MFSQKENLSSNLNKGEFNHTFNPFSKTLNEITEKAEKVRSLLEKRQRDDAIKVLISSSRNELISLNNFKSEIMTENQSSIEKVIGIVEKKLDDYLVKNEALIKLNIDQCVEKSEVVFEQKLESFLERILSPINIINTNNEQLCLSLGEQKNDISNHFIELNKSINDKNECINEFLKVEFNKRNEKENSLYLCQLRVIQKQYELIIRDLRKRNTILENDIRSKLINEEELENKVRLMNIKIEELSNLVKKKDIEISTLNSKLNKVQENNINLINDIKKLKMKNEGMINIFREKVELSKRRYISFGKGIYNLEFVVKKIRYKQIETAFIAMKSNPETLFPIRLADNENSNNKVEYFSKLIGESNLYSLIEVEKEIKEQEKEQNMINRLLNVIGEGNFCQLISFINIIGKKKNEMLRIAFLGLKTQ
ncbi:hypothetical protein FG386_000759 [Cryptosporidium ryanae]|uniref:uncharacterized protein n=1 Tax=Cryptosporidium ryanae TaxID=515981 RepID=UPI00351A81B2|nr:hypothetical protein FG386_000759 [Cryptosporidium ryanae]